MCSPHLFLAVDMLSDPNHTLPFDIPMLSDRSALRQEGDSLAPLNFDDLLDIAREFEFTRTITHIWPCEEPTTCTELGLNDIFAAIASPKVEEFHMSLSSSAPSSPVDIHDLDSIPDANAGTSLDPGPIQKDDDNVAPAMTSTLQGWSPPNGLDFLDLDNSLTLPPAIDTDDSPWPAMFLPPSSTQLLADKHQYFSSDSANDDVQLQMSVVLRKPPVDTTDRSADDPRKMSVHTPVQPSKRTVFEPVRARSTPQTDSNASSQIMTTVQTKTAKSRSQLPVTPTTNGTAKYARAPRGGIPPHIARSVTKVNILRVEKERKVVQDAFAGTTMGEAKKPSVLRRTVKVESDTRKTANGGGSGKKPFDWSENENVKEARAAKRAKV